MYVCLYPFISQWIFRLFLCLLFWIILQWAWECIYLFRIQIPILLDAYPETEMIDYVIILFWIFWVKSIQISIVAIQFFISTNIVQGLLFVHILLLSCVFLIITILAKPFFVLTYISLMINDFKYFFIHLLAVVCLIWRNASSNYLLIFNLF